MLITEKMDKLLQPSSVEFILYSKMNPTMSMLGMFNKQDLYGDKQSWEPADASHRHARKGSFRTECREGGHIHQT